MRVLYVLAMILYKKLADGMGSSALHSVGMKTLTQKLRAMPLFANFMDLKKHDVKRTNVYCVFT